MIDEVRELREDIQKQRNLIVRMLQLQAVTSARAEFAIAMLCGMRVSKGEEFARVLAEAQAKQKEFEADALNLATEFLAEADLLPPGVDWWDRPT